jgi:hypothetical protein
LPRMGTGNPVIMRGFVISYQFKENQKQSIKTIFMWTKIPRQPQLVG